MALGFRPGARHSYSLRRLAGFVSFVSIFLAAPFVLTGFWWRSMPKHDELLTVVFCGVPLLATVYAGWASWVDLRRLSVSGQRRPLRLSEGASITTSWIFFGLVLSVIGWMTTEGTLEAYARTERFWPFGGLSYYERRHRALVAELEALDRDQLTSRFAELVPYAEEGDEEYLADRELSQRWWMATPWPELLVSADLAEVALVETPDDWMLRDEAFIAFRRDACRAEGLSPTLCGNSMSRLDDLSLVAWLAAGTQAALRLKWCISQFGREALDIAGKCHLYFFAFDMRVDLEWTETRRRALTSLRRLDLSYADLRHANLSNARMENVILRGARMQGANLSFARMEGVYLGEARLEQVILVDTHLEAANLFRARMYGAELTGARIYGASFFEARMEATDLSMAGMDRGTNLADTIVLGASVRAADWSKVRISEDQINSLFGDASVALPGGVAPGHPDWPAHWPVWEMDAEVFETEWRKWQADPAAYSPPPPPEPDTP
jgi:uncharacterized protein YjbI with pentapeptide repeats